MASLYFKSCFLNHAILRNSLGHYLCGFSFLQLLTGLIVPHPHLWMALQWFGYFPITFIDFIDLVNILSFILLLIKLFLGTELPNADISKCFSDFNVHGNHLNSNKPLGNNSCCPSAQNTDHCYPREINASCLCKFEDLSSYIIKVGEINLKWNKFIM